jgi:hypothetical protein
MRKELQDRIIAVSAALEKLALLRLAGPRRVVRDMQQEKEHEKEFAIERAALEGAITVMEHLEELLGVPANTNSTEELAQKIKSILTSL